MPELPEIRNLARQMNRALRGREVRAVEVRQPKCLNVLATRFRKLVVGRTVGPVSSRGKWAFVRLEPDARLLVNLGMGGDLLYLRPGKPLPEVYQVRLDFTDDSVLTARFWWFGYVHAVTEAQAAEHRMTAGLGLDPLSRREFTFERFDQLLGRRNAAIKPFLLDQKQIARITPEERRALHTAIGECLRHATALGGLRYEKDLFGGAGRFEQFEVGYREGQPCPACGTTIAKIRTGSTASYICPTCQT